MLVKFTTNLGANDIETIRQRFGVSLNVADCQIDCKQDIADSAANWLLSRGAVAEVEVRGVAKKPEITAPAKYETAASGFADAASEKADAGLKEYRQRSARSKRDDSE